MIVRTFMTPDPVALRPEESCQRALALMQERGFHHLPVTSADAAVIGIVTERDLLLAVLNDGAASAAVAHVMHRDVLTVRDDMPMTHAGSLMARRAIGGLPVVDKSGRLIGVITETDIFRAFVAVLENRTARPSDAAFGDPLECAAVVSTSPPAIGRSNGKAAAVPAPKKGAKPAARAARR